MTATDEAKAEIRDLVKQARELERNGVTGPDWRSGQPFYHARSEAAAIALMPQLATALETLLEAVEEAEMVIDGLLPYAEIVIHSTDDAHEREILRAAAEWQRKYGTHGGSNGN